MHVSTIDSASKTGDVAATRSAQDPTGTIDGAQTPELIPNDVAYALFFNFVAGRATKEERSSLTSYLRQHHLDAINPDALISVGNDFQRASNSVSQVGGVTADVLRQRTVVINDAVSSLTARIGSDGADRLRRHVTEYLKTKVKIIPGPTMPAADHGMK
jgi:hypothetical protein